ARRMVFMDRGKERGGPTLSEVGVFDHPDVSCDEEAFGRGLSMWFAGVDAGGSETKLRLARKVGDLGQFVARGVGGPGNYQDVGAHGLVQEVQRALARAAEAGGLAEVPALHGLAIGAAGVGRP